LQNNLDLVLKRLK